MLVEVRKAIDDYLWLLRGSGIVEPDERAAIDVFLQDRKIAANGGDIKLAGYGCEVRQKRWLEVARLLRSRRRCDWLREGACGFDEIE